MNNILLAIGFKIVLTLPKKREVYHLKYQERTIEVLLDQIEGLEGDYFEAEIQVLEKEEIEEAKRSAYWIGSRIGLFRSRFDPPFLFRIGISSIL